MNKSLLPLVINMESKLFDNLLIYQNIRSFTGKGFDRIGKP